MTLYGSLVLVFDPLQKRPEPLEPAESPNQEPGTHKEPFLLLPAAGNRQPEPVGPAA